MKEELLKVLSARLTEGINEFGENYQAIQILPELKIKYPSQLRSEILSVRIYQTDTTCYLEVTEDKYPGKGKIDVGDAEIDQAIANNRTFLTERSVYFSIYELNAERKNIGSIFENAYSFIEVFDDESKIYTTNLFTKAGEIELMEEIEAKKEPPEFPNRSGERSYDSEKLKTMEGYASTADPEEVETPFFSWYIDNGFCYFNMRKSEEYELNNPFYQITYIPDQVQFNSLKEDDFRNHFIKIPVDVISQVRIKSEVDFSEPYKTLGDYEFTIDLLNGDKIEMRAYLAENPPEYWYYNHRVWVIKA